MNERQFSYMFRYANRLGIRTFGELAEYKKRKGAETNGDLIAAMFADLKASETRRSVS